MGFWARLKAKFAGGAPGPQAADVPVLMLDTGGHMAVITAIIFTPDGKQLISASHDKTIRVWDVTTGKTIRVLRGEVATGPAGKIHAMALSPNGKLLAAGGKTGNNEIRLYDFASSKLVELLKGHENAISGLTFSADGRYLMSGSSDKTAIIWDVTTRKALHCLKRHGAEIYAVGFTADSTRALSGCDDHKLRLWSVETGALLRTLTGHKGNVRSLAVAKNGSIASGDQLGEIRLWDGLTGAFLKTLTRQNTGVRGLSFSPDGKLLLSGVEDPVGPFHCHVYDTDSGQEVTDYRFHDNNVFATCVSQDARWAVTGGGNNHHIHIWNLASGERRRGLDGLPFALGGSGRAVWAAGFSTDGRRAAWGNTHGNPSGSTPLNERGPLEYALTLPSCDVSLTGPIPIADKSISRSAASRHQLPKGERRADATSQAEREPHGEAFLRATNVHGFRSLLTGKRRNFGSALLFVFQFGMLMAVIRRLPHEGRHHCAFSFSADGKAIISGGRGGWLSAYHRGGRKHGHFVGHEGDVWAVAPSPDGRYLVSGAHDQTVRLWNLATRELLVTLFHGSDGEWVMWTPQGYYVSSPDGDALIGWQINHGPAATPDHVEARQLARRLYRPDIITRTIELASAKAALAELGAPANIIDSLRLKRPPEFAILMPADGTKVAHNPAAIVVRVAANDDPVEGFELSVNGRQVASRDLRSLNGHAVAGFDPKTLNVPLEKGSNRIRITARNAIGETERELTLHFAGHGALSLRGTLYVVAVGVNDYVNLPKEASLRFAAADALTFRTTLERHAKSLHKGFESVVLAKGGDREPTRANIEDALALFRNARPEDTVMLFLAGHGTNEGPSRLLHGTPAKDAPRHTDDYLFLPQDSAVDGKGWRPSSVVRWLVFQNALQNARGRRLMFVDTCHAGGAYNPRLVKDAHDAEIIVFSATDAGAKALEMSELGHGVFTFALTQGLAGGAADGNGEVELFALQSYVSRQVKALSGGCQAPAIHLSGVKDFVIAKK